MKSKKQASKVLGLSGSVMWNGRVDDNELNPLLSDRGARYRTYGDILANTSIVAAGTRVFLNLLAKATWIFTPSDFDKGRIYADFAARALTVDPITPWHRIVRRAGMYRFYGFSIQEWVTKTEDGRITFADIMPRPQSTVSIWETDNNDRVTGLHQRSPKTGELVYLPRGKLLYIVDDALNDSPEGLGLFRHLVEPAYRIKRYEQLEGMGYETDLGGIPICYAPMTSLQKKLADKKISQAEFHDIMEPTRIFMERHVLSERSGITLDSQTYESQDDARSPSGIKLWDMKLLQSTTNNLGEIANAIKRLTYDIATILGVGHLLIGADGSGSLALSIDKTNSFMLLVDSVLKEIAESVNKDLIDTLWDLNGFGADMKPTIQIEPIQQVDVEQASNVLRNLALTGLHPDDPAINAMRETMSIPKMPEDLIEQQKKESGLIEE